MIVVVSAFATILLLILVAAGLTGLRFLFSRNRRVLGLLMLGSLTMMAGCFWAACAYWASPQYPRYAHVVDYPVVPSSENMTTLLHQNASITPPQPRVHTHSQHPDFVDVHDHEIEIQEHDFDRHQTVSVAGGGSVHRIRQNGKDIVIYVSDDGKLIRVAPESKHTGDAKPLNRRSEVGAKWVAEFDNHEIHTDVRDEFEPENDDSDCEVADEVKGLSLFDDNLAELAQEKAALQAELARLHATHAELQADAEFDEHAFHEEAAFEEAANQVKSAREKSESDVEKERSDIEKSEIESSRDEIRQAKAQGNRPRQLTSRPDWVDTMPTSFEGKDSVVVNSDASLSQRESERSLSGHIRDKCEQAAQKYLLDNGIADVRRISVTPKMIRQARFESYVESKETSQGDATVIYELLVFDQEFYKLVDDGVHRTRVSRRLKVTGVASMAVMGGVSAIFGLSAFGLGWQNRRRK